MRNKFLVAGFLRMNILGIIFIWDYICDPSFKVSFKVTIAGRESSGVKLKLLVFFQALILVFCFSLLLDICHCIYHTGFYWHLKRVEGTSTMAWKARGWSSFLDVCLQLELLGSHWMCNVIVTLLHRALAKHCSEVTWSTLAYQRPAPQCQVGPRPFRRLPKHHLLCWPGAPGEEHRVIGQRCSGLEVHLHHPLLCSSPLAFWFPNVLHISRFLFRGPTPGGINHGQGHRAL